MALRAFPIRCMVGGTGIVRFKTHKGARYDAADTDILARLRSVRTSVERCGRAKVGGRTVIAEPWGQAETLHPVNADDGEPRTARVQERNSRSGRCFGEAPTFNLKHIGI